MTLKEQGHYLPRLLDVRLRDTLRYSPAVVIEGPRGCGKTTTGSQAASSLLAMDEVDLTGASAGALSALLDQAPPLLVDEWQLAPALWNAVRRESDRRAGAPGQFILTGSSTLPDNPIRHSGAGRLASLRLRTFSSYESGTSNGAVSLAAMLRGEPTDAAAELTPSRLELAEAICRGGWPASRNMPLEQALSYVEAYVDAMCNIDIRRSIDSAPYRSTETARQVLRSLARNIGTAASVSALARDTASGEPVPPLDRKTLPAFLDAFENVYVREDCRPWGFQPASKQAMRVRTKRFLCDPSLATGVLRVGPRRLAEEPEFMGGAFESLVMRDLRAYAEANNAEVRYYAESGFEVDAVVEHRDGSWVAVEVKLSCNRVSIEKAKRALKLLAQRAQEAGKRPPSKLLAVFGVNAPEAHTGLRIAREDDGIALVPIAALGP
ncbi:MAG: DUF4143 domain-containing protein [Acidimicrobiaceae bacterium]|nr:DUF4143 domain-containing protein [Acidimicrobiaceae bacterium]